MAVFRSCGTVPVVRDDDVHDSQQEDVKVFIKKRVLIIFKTNSSVAGSKVSKGFPVKEVSWQACGF